MGTGVAAAADDAHGVFLCDCRNAGFVVGGCKGGKRSGGRAGGIEEAEEDEPAACATRSHSCLDDCAELRDAVECLAFRTRPLVTPAHCVPVEVGTSSGNCPRC